MKKQDAAEILHKLLRKRRNLEEWVAYEGRVRDNEDEKEEQEDTSSVSALAGREPR